MDNQNRITKVTQILQREDGAEVMIVAQAMFGQGLHQSVDYYVKRRASSNDPWILCSDKPHPDWRTMSVDDYIKGGRSEVRQTVSWGEIFKVTNQIGKPFVEEAQSPPAGAPKHKV